MDKPKEVQHLISIGFREVYGAWKNVWGTGDGFYYNCRLVKGTTFISQPDPSGYTMDGEPLSIQSIMDLVSDDFNRFNMSEVKKACTTFLESIDNYWSGKEDLAESLPEDKEWTDQYNRFKEFVESL